MMLREDKRRDKYRQYTDEYGVMWRYAQSYRVTNALWRVL